MARDFIFKIREGQALPAADPNGYRVLLDEETGLFKLLTSTGQVIESPGAASTASTSEYTETIIDVSSAQILNLAGSPVPILAAPGANKYYDINKIILEYTYGGSIYSKEGIWITDEDFNRVFIGLDDFTSYTQNRVSIIGSEIINSLAISLPSSTSFTLNKAIILTSATFQNPTGGNGTLRVKIYHKTLTFGA